MTASTLSPAEISDSLSSSHSIATCIDASLSNISSKTALSTSPPPNADSFSKCPRFTDLVFPPIAEEDQDDIWPQIQAEALSDYAEEPILARYYFDLILCHKSLESALSNILAIKLYIPNLLPAFNLRDLIAISLQSESSIRRAVRADLNAARDRDPACTKLTHCFLYCKGFLACQAHRVAHWLWISGRRAAAMLIQSRSAEVFAVDIHPRARIGEGVFLDRATGVVIGEMAVVGDDVSILHSVTLGGTGKDSGDRHPKIGDGVLIGAGTHILGNLSIGDGAKVEAGSVVLNEVPARTTAAGNPARLVGGKENPVRLDPLYG